MQEPIIIQCGNRRSVINGNTLQLQRLCNKRKPASIWPATEIEDESGRGKLLTMVKDSGLPTVICMTLNKPDGAPDLAAAGIGNTYWIENGVCRAVSAPAVKEAA